MLLTAKLTSWSLYGGACWNSPTPENIVSLGSAVLTMRSPLQAISTVGLVAGELVTTPSDAVPAHVAVKLTLPSLVAV